MSASTKPVLQRPPGYKDPNVPIYAAPNPQIGKRPLPPSFQPNKKRRRCCRMCYCFFCIFILILLLILIAAAALFYVWFDPKPPVYRLKSIKFSRFNISATSDGTYLTSEMVARIEAKNPNHQKITFYYGETEVRMTVDGDIAFGSDTIPAFTQASQNITVLQFSLRVNHALIDDNEGSKLKAQFQSNSVLVRAEVRTRFGVGVEILENIKLGTLAVDVLCGDVSLKELNAGTAPHCSIKFLKWINIRT